MKVINLFGRSGVGKSTLAANIFAKMKAAGQNVELVTEYAKDLVWSDREKTFEDQIYIFAKQHHRLHLLRNKVDYAIIDSPLPNSVLYNRMPHFTYMEKLVFQVFGSFDNQNFLLVRDGSFSPVGRRESEEESMEVENRLINLLQDNDIRYTEVVIGDLEDTTEEIMSYDSDKVISNVKFK